MRMRRRRKLRSILIFLGVLHAAVLLAAFLAPYHFAEQHRDFPFAPPTRLHWIDPAGRLHLRPFVYRIRQDLTTASYKEDPSQFYPLEFFQQGRLFGVPQPGVIFLLGSDGYGRDVFSRVLYGGQVSLFTGLAAAFLSLGLGLVFGLTAGYYSGWPDQILMRSRTLPGASLALSSAGSPGFPAAP